MTEVALAAGFGSVRRFNAVVRKTWQRTPRELRARRPRAGGGPGHPGVRLRLPFRPPFDWGAIVAFLSARAVPGVEVVGPDCYRRAVRLGESTGVVEVRPVPGRTFLEATVTLDRWEPLLRVVDRLRHLFDLDADPGEIGARLGSDRLLGARFERLPGVRVPGAWNGFELAVRAILGQQVSVRGATTLAGRLAALWGDPLSGSAMDAPGGPGRLFPPPEALADADLTRIGLTRARARAVSSVARAVADGRLDLDTPGPSPETLAALGALPGIGEWTVQYVAMRALGDPDAFLASDLGVRRALRSGSTLPAPREIARIAECWRPWRAYAVMLLWQAQAGGRREEVPAPDGRATTPRASSRRSRAASSAAAPASSASFRARSSKRTGLGT
jgi:AraC family transcriptional regulator of adaptative response / DNA-3-methyladenine glycosylase II